MASTSRKTLKIPRDKVIVGLDFGTTYSGFAYAHAAEPDNIYTYYDYPDAGAQKPYCKTITASYYKQPLEGEQGTWELRSWGYSARKEWEQDHQALRRHRNSSSTARQKNSSTGPSVGVLLTTFKLHLAGDSSTILPLPRGLTIERVIADYLRELGGLILRHLQVKYGSGFTSKRIQWCVTVPSIWGNFAKATMKSCMIAAGLVDAAHVHRSSHPPLIVLEPEAASFYCRKVMKNHRSLLVGDRLLVADIGGGTSDIVVQEVVSAEAHNYRVKEVTISSGGLCGGSCVDSRFIDFLKRKIGPCFDECVEKHPNVIGRLLQQWQVKKCSFGATGMGFDESTYIELPKKLVEEWESSDRRSGSCSSQDYDELEITHKEMQSIFDPVVQENVVLMERQVVEAGGVVTMLVLVGGFTESPYLVSRIREAFASRVGSIVCPQTLEVQFVRVPLHWLSIPVLSCQEYVKKHMGMPFMNSLKQGLILWNSERNVMLESAVETGLQSWLQRVMKLWQMNAKTQHAIQPPSPRRNN